MKSDILLIVVGALIGAALAIKDKPRLPRPTFSIN